MKRLANDAITVKNRKRAREEQEVRLKLDCLEKVTNMSTSSYTHSRLGSLARISLESHYIAATLSHFLCR